MALVAMSFVFPVVVHLAFSAPTGRFHGAASRAVVVTAYGWAAATSLLLALLRDPFYDPECWFDCDGNAFLLVHWPEAVDALADARPWAELALGAAVALVAGRSLVRSPGALRLARSAAAVTGAVAIAHALAVLATRLEQPLDPTFRVIFFAAAGGVVLAAAAVIAPTTATARRRRAVVREVSALDAAPAPADLERTLGRVLRDPELRIMFWLPALGCWTDVEGYEREPTTPEPGRQVTSLVRGGVPLASVEHAEESLAAVSSTLTPSVHLSTETPGSVQSCTRRRA